MNNRWNRQTLNQDNTQIITDSDPGPYIQPPPPVNPSAIQPISPTSDYPFIINVRDSLPDLGDDDQIRIRNITEIADSLDSDDTTIVPNDDGTITYTPKGSYLRNALIVEVEVFQADG